MFQSLNVEVTNARTLRYRTMAQRSVPRETARISVNIVALIAIGDSDSSVVEERARAALSKFVVADWLLSPPARSGDAAGYERVTLIATTRVALSENYNLADRARKAGSEGLSLQDPQVSYIIPAHIINKTVQALRLEVLAEAQAQADEFTAQSGAKWEVADIIYGVSAYDFGQRSGKGAYRSELDDLDEERQEQSASAERVRVFADIALRANS